MSSTIAVSSRQQAVPMDCPSPAVNHTSHSQETFCCNTLSVKKTVARAAKTVAAVAATNLAMVAVGAVGGAVNAARKGSDSATVAAEAAAGAAYAAVFSTFATCCFLAGRAYLAISDRCSRRTPPDSQPLPTVSENVQNATSSHGNAKGNPSVNPLSVEAPGGSMA